MGFLDYIDIFRTPITFSNRLSSLPGKICTIVYFGMFLYLALSGILTVFRRETKKIIATNSYDPFFQTDSDFFKKLHVNVYFQVYRTDNKKLESKPEAILKEFFKMQISYINSKCFKYTLIDMFDKLVYSKDNLAIFFLNYEINTLSDFFKFSIDKHVLKTNADLAAFFDKYTIRIYLNYFFLKDETKLILNSSEIENEILRQGENHVFENYGYADYVLNTKGSKSLMINRHNYDQADNNLSFVYKVMNLVLDPGVILSSKSFFKGFVLEKSENNINSKAVASVEFKLSAHINTFNFGFKKVAETFAEISGMMELLKFIMIIYILVINFVNTHFYFTFNFFDKKVFISNYTYFGLKARDLFTEKKKENVNLSEIKSNSIYDKNNNLLNENKANPKNDEIYRENVSSTFRNLSDKTNSSNYYFNNQSMEYNNGLIIRENDLDLITHNPKRNDEKNSKIIKSDNNIKMKEKTENQIAYVNSDNPEGIKKAKMNAKGQKEHGEIRLRHNPIIIPRCDGKFEKNFNMYCGDFTERQSNVPELKNNHIDDNKNIFINNEKQLNLNNSNENPNLGKIDNNIINSKTSNKLNDELFISKSNKEKNSLSKNNEKINSIQDTKAKSEEVFLINGNLDIIPEETSSSVNIQKDYFEKKNMNSQQLSTCKFFVQIFCPCLFKNSKNLKLKRKIFTSFMGRNFEKTDMMYLQNKIRYLDILIHLLLKDEQIALLDYVSKERFYMDCKNNFCFFKNCLKDEFSSEEKLKAFEDLKRRFMQRKLSNIDKRLIKILNDDLACHFNENLSY